MARLLVIEGNPSERRKIAKAMGCRLASAVYVQAIRAHFPDIECDVIYAADRGETLPAATGLEDYDGLVIGGSGLRAFDQTFAVTNQIALVRAFAARTGRPVLGSCWGLQIAAIAGGGTVGPGPNGREFGVARKIMLNEAGRAHPLYKGRPDCFDALCIHYDEVSALPGGATILCANAHSLIQGATFPIGQSEVWAVQYHPEFDLTQISMLITLEAEDLIESGFFHTHQERKAYQAKLEALTMSSENASLAWQLGLDSDVLDDAMRRTEIINWIEHTIVRDS